MVRRHVEGDEWYFCNSSRGLVEAGIAIEQFRQAEAVKSIKAR